MAKIPYKQNMGKKVVASAALVALLGCGGAYIALNSVAEFEGYVPEGYRDPVGIPTKCFGDTNDVELGREYSFDECAASLNEHLVETTAPLAVCIPGFSALPDKTRAAAASMAYNIGPTAFCSSSIARYFNDGDYERACRRMAEKYRIAGGKELPGLVKRRKAESEMCLAGLLEVK